MKNDCRVWGQEMIDGFIGGQIPYLGRLEIEQRVNELMEECWDGDFPVDVEKVADYLGIAIVPVEGLMDKIGVDAFISADFRMIYVDGAEYRLGGNRYRFSVAHELGHYVLHREYFSSRVESFVEWAGLVDDNCYGYVEFQANYFAGCLLAPEDEMVRMLDAEYEGSFVRNYYKMGRGRYMKVLAEMRRWFMVSEQVVTRRMRDTVYGLVS